MLFINIATVLALATMAQAFAIPSNPENGVYAVTIGEDGKEVHTKISDSTTTDFANNQGIKPDDVTTPNDLGGLESRDIQEVFCGCGFNMNHGHTDRAVGKLLAQVENMVVIEPGMSYYSVDSDVVSFMCNRSKSTRWYVYGTYRPAIEGITRSCGRYTAGATMDAGSQMVSGYARYKKGDNFCADATHSTSTSC